MLVVVLTLAGCSIKPAVNNKPQNNEVHRPISDSLKLCPQIVLGLKFDYPKSWGDCKIIDNKIYFRTDYKKYNVDLVAEIKSVNTAVTGQDFLGVGVTKKEKIDGINNSTIYNIPCGGGIACTVLNIDDKNFYEINWDVTSSQPIPEKLDGVWVPDYSFTRDDIWNILKSIKN